MSVRSSATWRWQHSGVGLGHNRRPWGHVMMHQRRHRTCHILPPIGPGPNKSHGTAQKTTLTQLHIDVLSCIVLASKASGHLSPPKSPLRTPKSLREEFLKNVNFKHIIEFFTSIKFPWHCIRILHFISISEHMFTVEIWVYCDLPWKRVCPQNFIVANHSGTKFLNPG